METHKPTNTISIADTEALFVALYNAFDTPYLMFTPGGELLSMNFAARQQVGEQINHDGILDLLPHYNGVVLLNELDSIAPNSLSVNLEKLGCEGKLQRLITPGLAINNHLLLGINKFGSADFSRTSSFQFLSRVATELKTPLNAIIGFSEVMRSIADRISGKDVEEFSSEIHKAGSHILSVVRYISDVSQIEAGQISLDIRPLNCHQLLDECLEQLHDMATKQNISFIRSYEQSNLINADAPALKRVLINLLSNAIKYNRENGRVTIRCTPKNNGEFIISISDSGKGLQAKQLNHLFEPFNRLNAGSEGIEGAGIGLAASRHLLESMGGKIWAESQVNKGSTFYLSLPTPKKQPPTLITKRTK